MQDDDLFSSSEDEGDEYCSDTESMKANKKKAKSEDILRQREFAEKEKEGVDYERLVEFYFDLCLSWCQYLDIETFLFFINGVFLNITKGPHINVSVFKEVDEIEVLSIEFFNHLLAYRAICEER